MVDLLEVLEHVSSTEQHGCGVGDVPSYSLRKRVACTLKEQRKKERGSRTTVKWLSNQ